MVAQHYEKLLMLARMHHIAGEMHAHKCYVEQKLFTHYLYAANLSVCEGFSHFAAHLRGERIRRAQTTIALVWDRVSDGYMSEESAERACAEILCNPGLADIAEILLAG